MYGYIYKTTNIVNGKIYIGQHVAKKFEPTKYFGSGTLLRAAIKKYSRENFKVDLLEIINTNQKDLDEKEIYYIALYNSTDLNIGYNLDLGGSGGGAPSEIVRKKLSEI